MADVVYLVQFQCGYGYQDELGCAYLTREEADAEVARIAAAVKRSKADGNRGVLDSGLIVTELPLGGHVEVEDHLYLARYV